MSLATATVLKRLRLPLASRSIFTSTSDAADIISERAALKAVKELEQNPDCTKLDINSPELAGALANTRQVHLGYKPANRIPPLVFKWKASPDLARQLVFAKEVAPERLPSDSCTTPMITLIDYVNENVAGHPGLIHGGLTATIAHSSMALVTALNVVGQSNVVSKSLNMDYRRPIRTGSFIKVHAWLCQQSQDSCFNAAAHFYDLENQVLAEAVSELAVPAKR
ncbi:hypothetical protein GGI12_000268 [Dipsacomyces acuminosporus]|nr:hypothetical protein GGI12_000268 [Dipsacomyces acuminosporus]